MDKTQNKQQLSVLLVFKINSEEDTINLVQIIINYLQKYPALFYFMDNKLQTILSNLTYTIFDRQQHASLIDLVITIGGDGTILYAAK